MPALPDFSAAQFDRGAPIDNPFFPLRPGTVQSYGGSTVDEMGEVNTERNDVFATFETKIIQGVQTVTVRDTAYANGVLVEDTLDWYAQDTEGNVWYFGEIAYNYEYDDEGNYVGTNNDGSWEAGVDGAQPGWIMKAEPDVGDSYFQEFAPGVAEDEAVAAAVNQKVTIGLRHFDGVLKTLDTTALAPDVAEFKYYAPGVGQVLVEEGLDAEGKPEFTVEFLGTREVGGAVEKPALPGIANAEEPEADDFEGDGSNVFITVLSEDTEFNNSLGAYTFDVETGKLGEGRILFTETDDAVAGQIVSMRVDEGEALGLFLVPDGGDLGLDLSAFEDGGLFFTNMLTGQPATIKDGLAPLVTNAEGDALPVPAFHALGSDDGFNFLNPAAGMHALDLESDATDDDGNGDVSVLGFEDSLVTEAGFDGDFNDVIVAVSDKPLSADVLNGLLGDLGVSADADLMIA